MGMRFSKMHGLGNDFVIVDCRHAPLALDREAIRELGDRHFGIGFDQLLTIERASDPTCAFGFGIWNADGSRSGQCGNGLRCVTRWLQRAGLLSGHSQRLQSPSGAVEVEVLDSGDVRADMGEPRFAVSEIPLSIHGINDDDERDIYTIEVAGHHIDVGAVSMGNPHALVEVVDVDRAEVEVHGPWIEHASAFPERCNVGFAQILARDSIRLRVWERGVGETLACGSGACAAVAVLRRRAKLDAVVRVSLPGGELRIEWDGHPGHSIWMTGPAAFVFEGEWLLPLSSG